MSRTAKRRLRWGLGFGTVGLVALATMLTVGSIGSRARSDRERVLQELIAASDTAQRGGDPGGAFREIEAAVVQARKLNPEGSSQLDALIERRDEAARAEVRSRLAALGQLKPEARAGEAQILADRARRDPALAALADPIAAALEAALTAQAEADRASAEAAFQAGRSLDAFRLASRAHDSAHHLASRADSSRIQGEARAVIVATVERFGATSTSDDSSKEADTSRFAVAIWTEALTRRGYLLSPVGSPWTEVWAAHAPFQVSSHVTEAHEGLYLQSQCRPTQIDGQFAITRRGLPHWATRIYAQTRAPLPDLPAYMAGRLGTVDHRDPDVERRLLEDARTAFRLQADQKFRGIPAPGSNAAPGGPQSPFAPKPGSAAARPS